MTRKSARRPRRSRTDKAPFQQAELLSNQKRVAGELEQQVARRTAELAEANQKLIEEIGERNEIEKRLQQSESVLQKAIDEITKSETKLRQVIDTIPALVWCNLPDGPNEFLNRRWHEYTGLSPEESHGWGWQVAFHPEDLPPLMKRWREILVSGQPGEIEARLRRHDGVYRWFLIRAEPLRDETGKIVRWFGTSTDIEDRKRAEEALQASEYKTRLLVDSIPGLVVRMTAAGEIEAVNRQLLDYFGKRLEDIRNWTTSGIVHPEDLARAIEIAGHSFATGDPYEMEIRVRRFDGVFRWFQARGLPVRDAEGRVLHWYALHTDIDDRKRTEEALRASEFNARMIVDGIPGLAARVSPAGEVEVVNRPLLEYFGKDLEEVRNWANTDAIYPDDLPLAIETFNNSLPTGRPFDVEQRLRRFDGVYRWFQSRGLPLRDPEGRTLHWYILLTDIEERKQAEDKLRRSEAFLAEGQHLAKMGNFSWRVAKGEITWSEQLYRIFEFEPGMPVTLELMGSRVHPDDVPMMFDMVEKARRGVDDFEYEHRLLMPDQSVKYVHMIAHGFRDKDGLLEYVGAAQDITERRLSEQALGKLRSELAYVARITSLGALTASMAHELNQPLSGVITNAGTCLRMLNADPPNVEGALETARRTIRDGNRASDVITRLRTLYSKKDISLEPMDLNEATREVISLCMSDLQRNRVILQHELAEDLPPIVGDRIQLQQVILNLLRNASDAMSAVEDRPRDLVIRTERDEEDRIRLSVQDAGVGIDAEAADRLFEAFYTTKSDGMGMGLSVSRSIIEAHRGRLWAKANDGPGATFSFFVPCHHADASATQTAGAN